MKFRSLLDPPVNLSTGPGGFGVSFQFYGSMRFQGPLDTPSKLYTGRVGVSLTLFKRMYGSMKFRSLPDPPANLLIGQ